MPTAGSLLAVGSSFDSEPGTLELGMVKVGIGTGFVAAALAGIY